MLRVYSVVCSCDRAGEQPARRFIDVREQQRERRTGTFAEDARHTKVHLSRCG